MDANEVRLTPSPQAFNLSASPAARMVLTLGFRASCANVAHRPQGRGLRPSDSHGKHGVRPYHYARQRHTTIMARARPEDFKRVAWEDVCDQLITRAMGSDGNDSTVDAR